MVSGSGARAVSRQPAILGFRTLLRRRDAASRVRACACGGGADGGRGRREGARGEERRKKERLGAIEIAETTAGPHPPPLTAAVTPSGDACPGPGPVRRGFGGLRFSLLGDGFSRGFCGGRWSPRGAGRGGLCWCCNGSHALPPPMPFGGCGWCILPSCGGAASARRAGGRGSGRVMCAVRGIVVRTGTAHQWAHGACGPRFTGAVDALRFVRDSCRRRGADDDRRWWVGEA